MKEPLARSWRRYAAVAIAAASATISSCGSDGSAPAKLPADTRDATSDTPGPEAGLDASLPVDGDPPLEATPDDDPGEVVGWNVGPLTVHVTGGTLQGQLDGATRTFLGVPYGASTAGAGRFAPPRPADAWAGVRMAGAYGPRCTQLQAGAAPPEGASEDCLSLNVFAPATLGPQPAAVMVFLPGGGFQVGGSADAPGQYLSDATHEIVVTLNYRVGPLAFMAHPALDAALDVPSGNLGIRDQRLALRWVQDNIAAFGGDPGRVTLFGQSAGALSTCIHQFSPGSAGLAQRFIMESGACVAGTGAPRTREFMVQATTDLANQLCPLASDLVSCLRGLPATSFVSLLGAGNVAAKFWPYVDGDILPEPPAQLLAEGRLSDAPFIVGSNQNEYRYFERYGYPRMNGTSDFVLNVTLNYPKHAQSIIDHYMPATDADADDAYVRLWTDEYFRCPARALVRGAASSGKRGRLYSFDVAPGAHAQDLDYVFGFPCCGVSWQFPDAAPLPPSPDVVRAMQGYWSRFAETGDPNGGSLPSWPSYDRSLDTAMVFAEPVALQTGLSGSDCDFWDGIYAQGE